MSVYDFLDLGNDMGLSMSREDALQVAEVFVNVETLSECTEQRYSVRIRWKDAARAQYVSPVRFALAQANGVRLLTAQKITDFLNGAFCVSRSEEYSA